MKRRTTRERKELKKRLSERKRQIRRTKSNVTPTKETTIPTTYNGPIDVVYLYVGSKWEEIRYSIKSVKKYFPEYRNIWVVGIKPDWMGDEIKHIEAGKGSRGMANKVANIHDKMMKIAMCDEISEDFVFMCDDFYILQPVTKADFYLTRARADTNSEEYYKRLNRHYRGSNHAFKRMLLETLVDVKKKGYYGWDGECHVPRIINRYKLKQTLDKFGNRNLWATCYLNHHFRGKPKMIGFSGLDVPGSDRLVYRKNQKDGGVVRKHMKGKLFFNHGNAGWRGAAEEEVKKRIQYEDEEKAFKEKAKACKAAK